MSNAPPLDGRRYIVDSCAWIKLHLTSREVQRAFAEALSARQLAICPPVLLEVLRGAPPKEFASRRATLRQMSLLATTQRAIDRALDIQEQIADQRPDGAHRAISSNDLLIAATAEHHSYGVLHYDADFDLLAEYLDFESRWLAPRGSL